MSLRDVSKRYARDTLTISEIWMTVAEVKSTHSFSGHEHEPLWLLQCPQRFTQEQQYLNFPTFCPLGTEIQLPPKRFSAKPLDSIHMPNCKNYYLIESEYFQEDQQDLDCNPRVLNDSISVQKDEKWKGELRGKIRGWRCTKWNEDKIKGRIFQFCDGYLHNLKKLKITGDPISYEKPLCLRATPNNQIDI